MTNITHSLPDFLQGTQVSEDDRPNFWQSMVKGAEGAAVMFDGGFMHGMMLESDIMLAARKNAENHGAGHWNYCILDEEKQLFFMYPEQKQLYIPKEDLLDACHEYGITHFTPQAYGFYVSLLAMDTHAQKTGDAHWRKICADMRTYMEDTISAQVEEKWSEHHWYNEDCPETARRCFEAYGMMIDLLDG